MRDELDNQGKTFGFPGKKKIQALLNGSFDLFNTTYITRLLCMAPMTFIALCLSKISY